MVKRHHLYERQENNVYCEIPVTFTQATLGAYIEVPMVDGKKEIVINKQTCTEYKWEWYEKSKMCKLRYNNDDTDIKLKPRAYELNKEECLKENKPVKLLYILTGSNQFELQEAISESLAGRTAVFHMTSFSFSEILTFCIVSFTSIFTS